MSVSPFAPGQFRCAKCGFRLTQLTLHTLDMGVTERDGKSERCPNDGAPLWRMTVAEVAAEREAVEAWNRAQGA